MVADGAACQDWLLEELLGWAPLVMALDQALFRLEEKGIRVDCWLGDFDGIANPHAYVAHNHPHIEVIHTPDQNATDFQKGIRYLAGRGYLQVHVAWATGRRMDHTFDNLCSTARLARELDIGITLYDDHGAIYPVRPGFRKWYPKDTIISLLPVGQVNNLTTNNLHYPLNSESLATDQRLGSSNVVEADGEVRLDFDVGGLLLIMESND